jgi:hypothetical protein
MPPPVPMPQALLPYLATVALLGCAQKASDPPAAAAAPRAAPTAAPGAASAGDSAQLRRLLIDERRSGQRSEASCYQYALDAARQDDADLDAVLIDYYRERGIFVNGDPVVMAFALHPGPGRPRLVAAAFAAGISSYVLDCSSATAPGERWELRLAWSHGYALPIADAVTSIY